MGSLLNNVFSRFNTNYGLQRVEAFMSKNMNSLGASLNSVKNSIETIRVNIRWMESNFNIVSFWLQENTNLFRNIKSDDFIDFDQIF